MRKVNFLIAQFTHIQKYGFAMLIFKIEKLLFLLIKYFKILLSAVIAIPIVLLIRSIKKVFIY